MMVQEDQRTERALRKLQYGNEVHVVTGVMKEIASEVIELAEHLERMPDASSQILEQQTSRINRMLVARCDILERLSKLI